MKNLRILLTNLHQNESGQDLIEYALIACLIALAAISTMSTLANDINNAFSKVGSDLSSAIG
jgi:pilus assembly protein Flp/PilA